MEFLALPQARSELQRETAPQFWELLCDGSKFRFADLRHDSRCSHLDGSAAQRRRINERHFTDLTAAGSCSNPSTIDEDLHLPRKDEIEVAIAPILRNEFGPCLECAK